MKIELKMNIDEMQYLHNRLLPATKIDIVEFGNKTKDIKLVTSIMTIVADKVCDKYEKLSRKPSLFDTKKKYQFTFNYHEAYALWVYLTAAVNNETLIYLRTMAIKLHEKLDKHFV